MKAGAELDYKVDSRYFFSLKELLDMSPAELRSVLSEGPVIYRWWFPEDSVIVRFMFDYVSNQEDDVAMCYLLERLKNKASVINGVNYYPLYLGKSTNGKKRFRNHIKGPKDNSTLRRTLFSLLKSQSFPGVDEQLLTTILSECCLEWIELSSDPELLDNMELMAISMGAYPLNIDGNHSISDKWKNLLCTYRN